MNKDHLLHGDNDIDSETEKEEVVEGLGHQEVGLPPFGISKADLDSNYLTLSGPSPLEV